jgi:hypothetical protein
MCMYCQKALPVYGPAVPVGAAVGAVATQHTRNVHAQA